MKTFIAPSHHGQVDDTITDSIRREKKTLKE